MKSYMSALIVFLINSNSYRITELLKNISTQYLQSFSSSQQGSQQNESFSNTYSAYLLTSYSVIAEIMNHSSSTFMTQDSLVRTTEFNINARSETQDYMLSSATLCCFSSNLSLDISSTELQRVLKSLLDQIN